MQVQAATRKSYRQAAKVLARAFLVEPVSRTVYRGLTESQRVNNLTIDFASELSVCVRRGEPLEVRRDGEIAAAAVIYPPGAFPLGWFDQKCVQAGAILGHTRYDLHAWQEWLEVTEKHHPQEAHYYLEYLGVEPAFQGKGLGSALMAELTRRADQVGVGCYLETATEHNVPLYRRFGFEVREQKEIIGLPAWFMWRPIHE